MYNELYNKALWEVITRAEFIELVPTLDLISLVRVVRRQFDVGLHESKVLAESLLAGADAGEAYDKFTAGVLRNPTEEQFIAACKELQARMEFGTLFRVLQRWAGLHSMPANFNEVLTWTFQGIFVPNSEHVIRYNQP